MIRIRRLYSPDRDGPRPTILEVERIFDAAFDEGAAARDAIAAKLAAPRTGTQEYILLVAEDARRQVLGFAFVHYYPDVRAGYLEWIASDPARAARGIGGALYEAVREELAAKEARGLYLDVPADDPDKVDDPNYLPVKKKRFAFYERYGARPIAGTLYSERTTGRKENYFVYLVYDGLGRTAPLRRAEARRVVAAILTRKYGHPPGDPHVREIVASFRDDPVVLRAPRYPAPPPVPAEGAVPRRHWRRPLKLVVAERHEIHHLSAKGYVERPVRMRSVLRGLEGLPVEERKVRRHSLDHVRAVHHPSLVAFIEEAEARLGERQMLYPEVFPVRHPDRIPKTPEMRAGYYCLDTFTPLTKNAFRAAKAAVDATLTAADLVAEGERAAYALVRPPGHHAERRVYGGFCYFNNAAVAAHRLSRLGRVATLDIDHHHGNGTQDIFWERADVLTLSIHGNPRRCYPYFAGYEDERGDGPGRGFNRNYPLQPGADDAKYLDTLDEALARVRRFAPRYFVLSLGFDIMRGDPTGTFVVSTRGMREIGLRIGRVGLPTLIVQEGGYSIWNLRRGAHAFFDGFVRTLY